jgi:hypothetical protein
MNRDAILDKVMNDSLWHNTIASLASVQVSIELRFIGWVNPPDPENILMSNYMTLINHWYSDGK